MKMKRIVSSALAALSIMACVGTVTACESAHPEVEMTITFNGEEYTLAYQLYRKVAPKTVNHFLWLAGNGYYDGLCVHNYDSTNFKMYTGAYEVATDTNDEDGLTYKPYYEEIKKFENFADFPVSVWADTNKQTALYNLYGEFESNNFRVTNGAKKQSYGSLTMYYDAKDTTAKVYAPYSEGSDKAGEMAARAYKYNSATSQFYISLSQTETSTAGYCTFATLDEDSVEKLKSFQQAIADYIEAEYGEGDEETSAASQFTTKQSVKVDEDDAYVGTKAKAMNFLVPNSPIVIKSVTVKKY